MRYSDWVTNAHMTHSLYHHADTRQLSGLLRQYRSKSFSINFLAGALYGDKLELAYQKLESDSQVFQHDISRLGARKLKG
ncbi:MAG: hypothetical protein R2880_08655 [Deinococcales bacterium]